MLGFEIGQRGGFYKTYVLYCIIIFSGRLQIRAKTGKRCCEVGDREFYTDKNGLKMCMYVPKGYLGGYKNDNNCNARKYCREQGMHLFNADESYDANFLAEVLASHPSGENYAMLFF